MDKTPLTWPATQLTKILAVFPYIVGRTVTEYRRKPFGNSTKMQNRSEGPS